MPRNKKKSSSFPFSTGQSAPPPRPPSSCPQTRLVRNRLSERDALENGFLLDGYPRRAEQAEQLIKDGLAPDCVIVLDRSSRHTKGGGVFFCYSALVVLCHEGVHPRDLFQIPPPPPLPFRRYTLLSCPFFRRVVTMQAPSLPPQPPG